MSEPKKAAPKDEVELKPVKPAGKGAFTIGRIPIDGEIISSGKDGITVRVDGDVFVNGKPLRPTDPDEQLPEDSK